MSKPSEKAQSRARIQLLVAMVAFGTIGLFVRKIALASTEIALWRGVIAFLVLTLFMLRRGKFKDLNTYRSKLGKLIFAGMAMGFNWATLFEAYRYTSIALSTLSYYFAPTIMVVGSFFLFKEKLSMQQIICFLLSTLGIVLIIGFTGGGSNDLKGVLFGLSAAVLYALVILTNKATGEVDGLSRTWIQFGAAILVLLPYTLVTNGLHIQNVDLSSLVYLLILGVFHTGLMYFLYFTALAHLKGQQVAILSYIDPIVAVLLSVTVLQESITILQLFGGLLILGSTLVHEVSQEIPFSEPPGQ